MRQWLSENQAQGIAAIRDQGGCQGDRPGDGGEVVAHSVGAIGSGTARRPEQPRLAAAPAARRP